MLQHCSLLYQIDANSGNNSPLLKYTQKKTLQLNQELQRISGYKGYLI